MALCLCKRTTRYYCFEHKQHVCNNCVCDDKHSVCTVKSFVDFLRDKRFSDPVCSLCSGAIGANTQLRFLCFHLVHSECVAKAVAAGTVSADNLSCPASAIPSEMDASTLAERIRGFVRSVGGNVKSAIPQTPGTPSAVQRPIAGTTPASAQRVPITAAAAAAAAAASSPVAPPDVVGAHTPEQDPIGRGSLVGHHPAAPVLPGSALPASTPPTPIVVPPPAAPPSGSAAVLLPSPPTTMPGVSPVVVLESGASFVGRAPVPLRSVDSPLRSSASGGGVVAGFASSVPVRRGRDADEVSVVVDGDDEEKVHAPPAALGDGISMQTLLIVVVVFVVVTVLLIGIMRRPT